MLPLAASIKVYVPLFFFLNLKLCPRLLILGNTGLLIGCDKKSEIIQHFQGKLCDKIGLLYDKLCDFFRAN